MNLLTEGTEGLTEQEKEEKYVMTLNQTLEKFTAEERKILSNVVRKVKFPPLAIQHLKKLKKNILEKFKKDDIA